MGHTKLENYFKIGMQATILYELNLYLIILIFRHCDNKEIVYTRLSLNQFSLIKIMANFYKKREKILSITIQNDYFI